MTDEQFARLNPGHPRTLKMQARAEPPPPPPPAEAEPVRVALPVLRDCIALGPVVDRARCACPRKHTYTCLKTGRTVTPAKDCTPDCPAGYEPDDQTDPIT